MYLSKELAKACFQHGMAHGDFKDLTRVTASDKILRYKAFDIAKYPKYDGYQKGLVSMAYKFLIKNLLVMVLKMRMFQTSFLWTYLKNHTNPFLENSIKEKYTKLLWTIFGMLILPICN